MLRKAPAVLAGCLATLFMALAVGPAQARNLSLSNQTIRMTFNNLELVAEGLSTMTCHVTLEGSFHTRTFAKVAGALVGYLTRATTGSCNNPVTILTATLPWHVRYEGFSGTLPNITLIIARISGAAFSLEPGVGIRCLATAELRLRAVRNVTTQELTGIEVPLQNVPLTGAFCPSEGSLRSRENGSVTILNSTTRISVHLI
jgi:hypothetical protein